MTKIPQNPPKGIALDDELKKRLRSKDLMPDVVNVRGHELTLQEPIGDGFKGVVWSVIDTYGRRRALKFTIPEEHSYLKELYLAARLEGSPYFAHFIDAEAIRVQFKDGITQPLVVFLEEWVDGSTVFEFLAKNATEVTASFLIGFVKGICSALGVLRAAGLQHDDLHAKNVMLARPKEGEPDRGYRVRVIDTGSLKARTVPTKKIKDDVRQIADQLAEIHNTILVTRPLTLPDRRFLSEIAPLLQKMVDDDPSIRLDDPAMISEQFTLAHKRSHARSDMPSNLNSPFEFISAEHIADDRMLVRIFATSCPWLEKVSGPDPCLVTGPRGCGKSTMFRWLSLKAHLHKPAREIDVLPLAGFYLSCSTDLQNRLSWIKNEELASRFERELIHYFNLLLLREIVLTLGQIADRADRDSFWSFDAATEGRFCDFLMTRAHLRDRIRIQGVSRLFQIVDAVESDLFVTHDALLRGANLTFATPATLIGDLTSFLVGAVDFFKRKRIAFLVDDFSVHRLPPPVQVVLNRVIWERRSSHVFKLSSEKHGAVLSDTFAATADVSREFIEVDCGREYVALDDADQVARSVLFAEELLNHRLEASNYLGRAETLVGRSSWPEGSLARALCDKPLGRILDQYHGMDCIANICSGDISTLLMVYRRMFEGANVQMHSTAKIAPRAQHDAIVSVSRELFEAIRHHFPHGPAMHSIVHEFGRLARKILEGGKWQKKGTTEVPTQCPRIEIDQKPQSDSDNFTRPEKELARELVRRAIFIEMESGLSRHGNTTSLRWQLRRVYLPTFGAALAKNNAVKKDNEWFRFFLTSPEEACALVWSSWPKPSSEDRQHSLFSS